MRLFTKTIDQKLFKQYPKGSDLENQMVVAKIFNPYGRGRWYLINSDPNDPDYIWAIVETFEVEVGSVSRKDLENIKIPPFGFGLERDIYFSPVNAMELYLGLKDGKKYAQGGMTEHGLKIGDTITTNQFWDNTIVVDNKKDKSMAVVDLESGKRRESKYENGGKVKWQDAEVGDSALVVSENKIGLIVHSYGRKFHIKFPSGTEKTYDASELSFIKEPQYADGGPIGSGTHGYIAFYKNKRVEVYADTMYEAQKIAAAHFKVKKTWEVNVVLAEVNGQQHKNPTDFENGGAMKLDGDSQGASLVGKRVSVKLPNEPSAFKVSVMMDLGNDIITDRGVFSKKYIIQNRESGGDIERKQEWVAIFHNLEKPNEQKVISVDANTKTDAIREAGIAKARHGLGTKFELVEIYTYSGNLPMMEVGGSLYTMPKDMMDEIRKSVQMGYTTVQVGWISPKKKGVLLTNDEYQVRGTYPLEYKDWIEQIVAGKYADGGGVGKDYYIVTFGFNGDDGYQVVKSKPIYAGSDDEAAVMLKDQFESYEGMDCDVIKVEKLNKKYADGGGVAFNVGDSVKFTQKYFGSDLIHTGVIEEINQGVATIKYNDQMGDNPQGYVTTMIPVGQLQNLMTKGGGVGKSKSYSVIKTPYGTHFGKNGDYQFVLVSKEGTNLNKWSNSKEKLENEIEFLVKHGWNRETLVIMETEKKAGGGGIGKLKEGVLWKMEWTDQRGVKGYDILKIVDTNYFSQKYSGGVVVKSEIIESSKPERVGKTQEDDKKTIKEYLSGKYPFASLYTGSIGTGQLQFAGGNQLYDKQMMADGGGVGKSPIPSYAMYSQAGNRACHALTLKVVKMIDGDKKVTGEVLSETLRQGAKKIAEKHGEIYDGEPKEAIAFYVNQALKRNGYSFRIDRYFDVDDFEFKQGGMAGGRKMKKKDKYELMYDFVDEKMIEGDEEATKMINTKGYSLTYDELYDYIDALAMSGDSDAEDLIAKLNKFAKGGMATFDDKVKAISSRLEGTKVKPKYRKDYGATYDKAEAKQAATKIAGSLQAKENSSTRKVKRK